MHKTTRFIMIFALLVLLCITVGAQHVPPPALEPCDYAGLADRLENLPGQLRTSATPRTVLASWMILMQTFRADCDGYSFHSDDYGVSYVTNPIQFADGIYRVTLSGTDWTTLHVTALAEGCPLAYIYLNSPGPSLRQETWVLEDCTLILEFNGHGRWLFRMEPLS